MRLILKMDRRSGGVGTVLALLAVAIVLVGCGTSGSSDTNRQNGAAVQVVASTDVYGDIASRIGGPRVKVTSIIDDPSIDPHDYQATVRDALAVRRAQVVIVNGGGYDDFMTPMLARHRNDRTTVLDAVAIAQAKNGTGESAAANEHVWYDFAAMGRLGDRLAEAFADADPTHRADYRRRANRFSRQIAALETRRDVLAMRHEGRPILATEPVAANLTDAMRLHDVTPEGLEAAVEDGRSVSARATKAALDLVATRSVAFLLVNTQSLDQTVEALTETARKHRVPIVEVTETLPAGNDYLSWMRANLTEIETALSSSGKDER